MGHLGAAIYFLCVFLFSTGMAIAAGLKQPIEQWRKLVWAFVVLAYIALCCFVVALEEFWRSI